MMALLLADTGELSRAGLLCEHCEAGRKATPRRRTDMQRQRRYRGCLERPVVTIVDPDSGQAVEREWTPALRDALAERQGMMADAEFAEWHYAFAGLGGIEGALGCQWDACPRSYSEFARGEPRAMATAALDAVLSIDSGVPQYALGGEQPTPRMRRLISAGLAALRSIRAKREREAADEARQAAALKGRRR